MGGCCVKGVPLTLCGHGDKLEICSPAPLPPHSWAQLPTPPPTAASGPGTAGAQELLTS